MGLNFVSLVRSGSLFDFALYFFHNYQALLAKGSGPYFYLPKTKVITAYAAPVINAMNAMFRLETMASSVQIV